MIDIIFKNNINHSEAGLSNIRFSLSYFSLDSVSTPSLSFLL